MNVFYICMLFHLFFAFMYSNSLRSRRIKIIWAQERNGARETPRGEKGAPLSLSPRVSRTPRSFLCPRYFHAPATLTSTQIKKANIVIPIEHFLQDAKINSQSFLIAKMFPQCTKSRPSPAKI